MGAVPALGVSTNATLGRLIAIWKPASGGKLQGRVQRRQGATGRCRAKMVAKLKVAAQNRELWAANGQLVDDLNP